VVLRQGLQGKKGGDGSSEGNELYQEGSYPKKEEPRKKGQERDRGVEIETLANQKKSKKGISWEKSGGPKKSGTDRRTITHPLEKESAMGKVGSKTEQGGRRAVLHGGGSPGTVSSKEAARQGLAQRPT